MGWSLESKEGDHSGQARSMTAPPSKKRMKKQLKTVKNHNKEGARARASEQLAEHKSETKKKD